MLKITATRCIGKDLKPGDLFSIAGPIYWDNFPEHDAIGEKVYIRTDTPATNAVDFEATVYKITIEKGE